MHTLDFVATDGLDGYILTIDLTITSEHVSELSTSDFGLQNVDIH